LAARLPVIEIFGPTIQGEGPLIGHRTVFIRLAYCDYLCSWCDTKYAVDPQQAKANLTWMSVQEIVNKTKEHGTAAGDWVTLTGGNPLLHDCSSLVALFANEHIKVAVETQGSLYSPWVTSCDLVVVSPKPPSSGIAPNRDVLDTYANIRHSYFKVVVFDEVDFEYAREIHNRYPKKPLYLQVGNKVHDDSHVSLLERLRWLTDMTLATPDLSDVVVLPQLHVMIWGNARGV
jgi:7-carboxy-7-deazaguanine synthase